MAGDWIKMRAELHTHPKVVRILSALNADICPHPVRAVSDTLRVVGALHAVWCVFDTHSDDGYLRGYTPETMDAIIGWPGFTQAMINVGWAAMDGETLVMPGFAEHNGQSAKRRAQEAKRKNDVRKDVRNLSALDADNLRTREEKRREEKKDSGKRVRVRVESQNDSTPASDASPPIVEIPLNDGTAYGIYAEQVSEWSLTYRNIDVPQQLREMRQWCIANPRKRKTKRGVLAFANRWLSKEQDKPSLRSGNGRAADDPFKGGI